MRKVLILAPTFFPDPAVSGIRATQWARHLPEFGWQPLVLCRHHGHTATPENLAAHVSPEVQVEYLEPRTKTAASSEQAAGGLAARVKHQLVKSLLEPIAVPDPLLWKWKSLHRQAVEIARNWQPDVVLSTSPPHSILWLARELARTLGVPWVADFRDPYLIDSRYGIHGVKRLLASQHVAFEREIYRDAALCLHAIPLHGRWASRRYRFARDRIRILTNGVPPELLEETCRVSGAECHGFEAGSRRVSIRAAGVLGQGAVELIGSSLRRLCVSGMDAEFRHVGHARDATEAVPADLRGRLHFLGPVSHAEALREIAGADVLFNYLDWERAQVGGLSSKLFEYLAVGKPIVAVNSTRADRLLLRGLPWCWLTSEPQSSTLADAFHQAITSGNRPSEEWLSSFRVRYNRRNQTGRLAGWLEDVSGPKVRH